MAVCVWTTSSGKLWWKPVKAARNAAHILQAFVETAAEWKEEGDVMQVDGVDEAKACLKAWATTLDQRASANDVALMVPYFRVKTSWAAKDTP